MFRTPRTQSCLSRRTLLANGVGAAAALLNVSSLAATQGASQLTTEELLDTVLNQRSVELAIEGLVEVFARSGIAVFDDEVTQPLVTPASPLSPLSFQRWQLAAMVMELSTGNGRPASDYDPIFPDTSLEGDACPTVGELLAAYSASELTPGSAFAGAYFGLIISNDMDLDAADLPAPSAIMSLLSGEILGQFQQAAGLGASGKVVVPASASGPTIAAMRFAQAPDIDLPGLPTISAIPEATTASRPPIDASTICGMAQSFLSIVMQRIFSVLKAAENVTDIPLIGGLLGLLLEGVDLGINVITKAVDALLAPVMGVIKAIAAGLAVASMLVGTLTPWTVTLGLRPTRTRFGIDVEVVSGEVQITAGGWDRLEYPPVIRDCAALAGITLPKPTSKDSPVVVTAQQSRTMITLDSSDLRLNDVGTATATYTTAHEPADYRRGNPVIGIAWIQATLEREDLKRLREDLFDLLFSQLPELVANVVRPMMGPTMDNLTTYLLDLLKVTGSQPLFVMYHEPPDDPTPTADPGGSSGSKPDCLPGKFRIVDPFVVQRMFMPYPMEVTGTNTWEFRDDGRVVITFNNLLLTLFPDPSVQFTLHFSGTLVGTYSMEAGTLSVQITENHSVVDTDMIALRGQIAGITPSSGLLSGPYTCGNPIRWTVSYPEVGEVTYELVPTD